MLSFIKKTEVYKIIVKPRHSTAWEGLFNFKPNAEDVATAMRKDIDELDPVDEFDYDIIQSLKQTLELVTFWTPELLGEVKIAGALIGNISISTIKVFAKEESSMMPVMVTSKVPTELPDGFHQLSETQRLNLASEYMRGGSE